MLCTYAQYCRIELKTGKGIHATRREIIKAAHTLLLPATRGRAFREMRHSWLRSVLEHHADARGILTERDRPL